MITIEEKAQRYDDAINAIKELKAKHPTALVIKDWIKENFPELAESEDEKIRKWLICTLKSLNNSPVQIDGAYEMMLPAIDWLKKQGEQKPDDIYPIFRVGDYIRNKKTSDKVLIEQLNIAQKAYCYVSYDGAAVNHSDFPFVKENEWELIGQKVVEQNLAWSEEDEKMVNQLVDFMLSGIDISKAPYGCVAWLKSLRPQNTWKPSEEQLKALNAINVTGCISYAGQGQELVNLFNDLKKLKE